MADTNGIPRHVNDFTPCTPCSGTGRAGVFREFECNACGGTGRDYGIRIAVQAVTFVPAPEPRELTHVEKTLLLALR